MARNSCNIVASSLVFFECEPGCESHGTESKGPWLSLNSHIRPPDTQSLEAVLDTNLSGIGS